MKSILFFVVIGANYPIETTGYRAIANNNREYTIFIQDTCKQIGDTIFIVARTKVKL